MAKSVYQTEIFVSLNPNNIRIDDGLSAKERIISLPFTKKRILQTRGNLNKQEIEKFLEASKNYFYGTISPVVVKTNEKLLEECGLKKEVNFTILVNLKKNAEDLWNALEKKSARWGVKTAKKNGLSFMEADEKDLKEFYGIYKKTAKEGGFEPESYEFIKSLRNSEISKLFLIKNKKKILAGGLILIDKEFNYSILDLTSSSDEGNKLQAMPLLYWSLIEYSKSLGLEYFDLGGYDKEAREGDKTYNVNKFKERFGGETFEQPIYSTNWKYPLLRKIYRKIKFLRSLL